MSKFICFKSTSIYFVSDRQISSFIASIISEEQSARSEIKIFCKRCLATIPDFFLFFNLEKNIEDLPTLLRENESNGKTIFSGNVMQVKVFVHQEDVSIYSYKLVPPLFVFQQAVLPDLSIQRHFHHPV